MNQDWLKHPTLRDMDPRKKKVLANLIREANGKPIAQSLPLIMKANSELQSQGLSFTPPETSAIMQILTKDMSPQELSRLEMMKSMMNNLKRT